MKPEEINFLEQLYARYKLRVGNKTLKSNKGVAQGSIISPALFNIFLEANQRQKQELILKICSTTLMIYYQYAPLEQIKKAIQVISDWSDRNGMLLNKKKSGILIFANRKATKIPMMKILKNESKSQNNNKWSPTQVEIDGIPINI